MAQQLRSPRTDQQMGIGMAQVLSLPGIQQGLLQQQQIEAQRKQQRQQSISDTYEDLTSKATGIDTTGVLNNDIEFFQESIDGIQSKISEIGAEKIYSDPKLYGEILRDLRGVEKTVQLSKAMKKELTPIIKNYRDNPDDYSEDQQEYLYEILNNPDSFRDFSEVDFKMLNTPTENLPELYDVMDKFTPKMKNFISMDSINLQETPDMKEMGKAEWIKTHGVQHEKAKEGIRSFFGMLNNKEKQAIVEAYPDITSSDDIDAIVDTLYEEGGIRNDLEAMALSKMSRGLTSAPKEGGGLQLNFNSSTGAWENEDVSVVPTQFETDVEMDVPPEFEGSPEEYIPLSLVPREDVFGQMQIINKSNKRLNVVGGDNVVMQINPTFIETTYDKKNQETNQYVYGTLSTSEYDVHSMEGLEVWDKNRGEMVRPSDKLVKGKKFVQVRVPLTMNVRNELRGKLGIDYDTILDLQDVEDVYEH